jgi:hypothetical protein
MRYRFMRAVGALLLLIVMLAMTGCAVADRLTEVLYPTPDAVPPVNSEAPVPYPDPVTQDQDADQTLNQEQEALDEAYPAPASGRAGVAAEIPTSEETAAIVADGDGEPEEGDVEPQEGDPYADSPWTEAVEDEWGAQFMQGAKDWDTTATVVAHYVDEHAHLDDETLSQQLGQYLALIGDEEMIEPQVRRLSDDLFLAHLPPRSLYLLEGGEAGFLVDGDRVLDICIEGDELGLIFASDSTGSVQPAFVLLRRAEKGIWQPVWMPVGHRDWVTTDGEIRFTGAGLNELAVSGTSFGLDEGIDRVFDECQFCPHRHLSATWRRLGDTYVRQTALTDDASLYERYWEMTERTPYAVLYESLRRLRQGLAADELLANDQVLRQIRSLELLDIERRFTVVEETDGEVIFADVETDRHYRAQVEDGQLVRVERARR